MATPPLPLLVRADALARTHALPWEWTDLTPEEATPAPALVTAEGAVFRDDAEYRHVLRVGAVGDRDVTVLGALAADEARVRALPEPPPPGHVELWRFGPDDAPLRLGGPTPMAPRPAPPASVGLLCDLGRVLVGFRHELFLTHFRLVVDRPAPAGAFGELMELLPAVEDGRLSNHELWLRMREPLGLGPDDEGLFRRLWCSILHPLPAGAEWVRRTVAPPHGAGLVVVSNVDPWRLSWVREELGLADLLGDTVASFEPGVRPKFEDDSMWRAALERLVRRRGGRPELVVALDDRDDNLATADGVADARILVRHPAQMRRALADLGVFLPTARPAVRTARPA